MRCFDIPHHQRHAKLFVNGSEEGYRREERGEQRARERDDGRALREAGGNIRTGAAQISERVVFEARLADCPSQAGVGCRHR